MSDSTKKRSHFRGARHDSFIAVDTEAVSPSDRQLFQAWSRDHRLDAIVSADGDGDRPLVADEAGRVIPGDILGVLTARHLAADLVCTPVSSNDLVRRVADFQRVDLTRIGSPYVIEEMEKILVEDREARVVGFEANGGFLLGFQAAVPRPLSPLLTRDCIIPILAPLAMARSTGTSLSWQVQRLPTCYTAADRIQDIDRELAADFLAELEGKEGARNAFFAPVGAIVHIDLTDGLRVEMGDGSIIHLRPSGNAPEFRVYAQADSEVAANGLVQRCLAMVADAIRRRQRRPGQVRQRAPSAGAAVP